jgi:hypothetical protein
MTESPRRNRVWTQCTELRTMGAETAKRPLFGRSAGSWGGRSGPLPGGRDPRVGDGLRPKLAEKRPFSGILRNGDSKKSRPKVPVKHGTRQFIQYLKQLFFSREKKNCPPFFPSFVQNPKKKPVTAKILRLFDPFYHLWKSHFFDLFHA